MTRAVQGGCAALVLLAGCSLGGDRRARPAQGAPKAVAATVEALDRATRERDFRRICDELFTPSARERAGGRDCARLLSSAAKDVVRPRIQIVGIRIEGRRATVRVRSRVAGQRPLEDQLELVREGGRYRISALAG